MSNDWYRTEDWSEAKEDAFFARLSRSRTMFHKAQYLRIQALTLASTEQPDLIKVALRLLERVILDYPDPSQLAAVHFHAAGCHSRLRNLGAAISCYREALAAQRSHRGIDPGTAVEYPWFIVRNRLSSLYDEALRILEAAQLSFPIQLFKAGAIRAVIAESRGDDALAARHAREALCAAGLKESQFRYHRTLGLVGDRYQEMIDYLTKLAAA